MTSKNSTVRAALLACLAAGVASACSGSDGVASPGEGVFVLPPPAAPPVSPPTAPPSPAVQPAATCPDGFLNAGTITVPGGSLRNCQLPALVANGSTLSLQAADGVVYSVSGRVDIGVDMGPDPAVTGTGSRGVLNVAPGVRLFGSGGTDYLVVNRGSAINANGTADSPIIFTSRQSIQGLTDADSIGQWGGLVILGRAPISNCNAGGATLLTTACINQVEGTSAFMGGATNNDNSGQIRYLRLQHSGFEILPGNELNGITLGGVGSNTILQNIQVHNSSDDGIEIFGGTVNLSNIVLTGNDDDSYDVDWGWRGHTNTLLAVQRPNGGDRVFEFSSAGRLTPQAGPYTLNTRPVISNATLLGRTSTAASEVITINSGNGVQLYNSVVGRVGAGGDPCLDIDTNDSTPSDTSGSTVIGAPRFFSVFMGCTTDILNDNEANTTTGDLGIDRAGALALFTASGSASNTNAGTLSLAARTGTSSVAFLNGATETAVARTVPVNNTGSTFFGTTAPAFIGAATSSSTWYQGWTCSPLIGEENC